jgi:uncharacterized membrane protein
VIGANFFTLLAGVVLCLLPGIAIDVVFLTLQLDVLSATPGGHAGGLLGPFQVYAYAASAVRFLFSYVAQGAIIFIAVEYLAGQPVSLGQTVRVLGSRVVFIVLTAIVQGLLVGLGFMACIIPGVLLSLVYYVAIPSCVAERTGPIQSLYRSAELTRGVRGSIFLISLVVGIIGMMVGGVVVLGAMPSLFSMDDPDTAMQSVLITQRILEWIISPIQTLLISVPPAVVYVHLRGMRDGVDAHKIAEVFA